MREMNRGDRVRRWLSGHVRGYLLAAAATATLSVTFVASKAALRVLNPETFAPLWFATASLYAWLYSLARREWPGIAFRREPWALLAIGATNALSSLLFIHEIRLTDPSLVSFFGRLTTVFTVLLGVIVLGERLRRREWLGAGITLLGAGLITYGSGPVVFLVFLLAVADNLAYAVSQIIARRVVGGVSPAALTTWRATLTCLLTLAYVLLTDRWQAIPPGILPIIIAGAFVGPFLSFVLWYEALARLEVSRAAVVGAGQPFVVTLYALILLGTLPQPRQLVGGLVTVAGVVLLLTVKAERTAGQ